MTSPATRYECLVLMTVLTLAFAGIAAMSLARDRLKLAGHGPAAAFSNVIAPTTVFGRDRYVLYAGTGLLPEEAVIHVRICHSVTGSCILDRRTDLAGQGEYWGFIGAIEAVPGGNYDAAAMLATRNPLGVMRTSDLHLWTVHAADE